MMGQEFLHCIFPAKGLPPRHLFFQWHQTRFHLPVLYHADKFLPNVSFQQSPFVLLWRFLLFLLLLLLFLLQPFWLLLLLFGLLLLFFLFFLLPLFLLLFQLLLFFVCPVLLHRLLCQDVFLHKLLCLQQQEQLQQRVQFFCIKICSRLF